MFLFASVCIINIYGHEGSLIKLAPVYLYLTYSCFRLFKAIVLSQVPLNPRMQMLSINGLKT